MVGGGHVSPRHRDPVMRLTRLMVITGMCHATGHAGFADDSPSTATDAATEPSANS
jgi:hypothetical protein